MIKNHNIQVCDPAGYKYSLTTSLLIKMLKKNKVSCIETSKLDKRSRIILFTFRSPWPNFYWALQKMRDANIPVLSKDRTKDDPLIICGGIAMLNTLPFKNFFDAAWIGDATRDMFKLIANINERENFNKKQIINDLDKNGFLVPTVGKCIIPIHIKRSYSMFAHVLSLDRGLLINRWWNKRLSSKAVLQIEIKRGCGRGCSFCVDHNKPSSGIKAKMLADIVTNVLERYKNLYLVRLSFSTLNEMDLLKYINIVQKVKGSHNAQFRIDIGSTVPDEFSYEVACKIKEIGQNSMVFAPEVAQGLIDGVDLRRENKKWFTDEILFKAINNGVKAGLSELTLYHLTGFPGETFNHLKAYVTLVKKIVSNFSKLKKIIISSGPLFATVGTKLENVSQITFKEAKRRWLYFSRLLKNEKKVNVLWWLNIQKNKLVPYESNPEISFLRAYFYRGIEEMGNVLLRLVNKYPNRGDYLKINVNELEKIMLEEGIDTSDIFNFRDTIKRIKLNRIYH